MTSRIHIGYNEHFSALENAIKRYQKPSQYTLVGHCRPISIYHRNGILRFAEGGLLIDVYWERIVRALRDKKWVPCQLCADLWWPISKPLMESYL